MPRGRTRPLTRRYTLGVAAVALPLLLLIGGLAGTQFAAERAARLELIARDFGTCGTRWKHSSGRPVITCGSFVSWPRTILPDASRRRPRRCARCCDRRAWKSTASYSRAVLLDRLAGTQSEGLIGNLHGRADIEVERAGDPLEVDMALNLFEPMRVAHLTNPQLRWSYYFSGRGDFLVVYPFATGRDFMQALQARSVDEYLGAMYAYDVYRMATPARNPERDSYWTPVYSRCGRGRVDGQPCRPSLRSRCLRGHGGYRHPARLPQCGAQPAASTAWPGMDRRRSRRSACRQCAPRAPAAEAPSIAAALPEAIAALPLTELLEPSTMPRKVGGWETMALPLGATPWHLVFVADEAEITSLVLARLWPYALLLEWRAGDPGHCPASAAAILRRACDCAGWSCAGPKQRRARAVTAKSA